jgi:hypothetical protein
VQGNEAGDLGRLCHLQGLSLLVDEVERMKRGRDSRSFSGRWLWHARTVGQMIGNKG